MDTAEVVQSMLTAAEAAAGISWTHMRDDFVTDLKAVVHNAEMIANELNSGMLSADEAELLLRNQSRTLFILLQQKIVEGEIVVQNVINAALDALWTAVRASAHI